MKKYDPDVGPVAAEWLEIPEAERIDMVAAYHRRRRISLPNRQLHSTIHVVVENQLALGERVVIQALERLLDGGLDRHDAIHAIGMVLSEHTTPFSNEAASPGRMPRRRTSSDYSASTPTNGVGQASDGVVLASGDTEVPTSDRVIGHYKIVREFRARFFDTKLFFDTYAGGKFAMYLFRGRVDQGRR